MKYKVGDKVKVRSDLREGKTCGAATFVVDMFPMCGKVAEISEVRETYGSYYIKDFGYNWTDEMFEELVKEDGKMYASELMELARKEPEKYEGKRYRVLGLCCIGPERQHYSTVIVDSEGKLQGKGYDNWAYINSNTKLEEIPQSVPFAEAAAANEAGNTVECVESGYTHTYANGFDGLVDEHGNAVTVREILHGEWFIKEA
jgi:hypothetical protein